MPVRARVTVPEVVFVALTCISLMTQDPERLFLGLLAVVCLWEKIYFFFFKSSSPVPH